MNKYVANVLEDLKAKQPWEKEFLQAAEEVLSSFSTVTANTKRTKFSKEWSFLKES